MLTVLSRLQRLPIHRLARPFSSRPLTSCPSCHSPLPTPLPACPKCSYISHIPSSTPYHQLFGLPVDQNPFKVDSSQLASRFRALQRVIHPDAWSIKGNNKYDIAASLSSLVNTAYKTLRQPLPRVEYILSLHDLQPDETDGLEDSELIMDVLESRETLEQASSRDEVDLVQSANQVKIDELLVQIESLVEHEDWPNLKTAAIKLKYLQGIADAAHAWPDRVFDH